MPIKPFETKEEAKVGLTTAFQPETEAQRQAIATASALVPEGEERTVVGAPRATIEDDVTKINGITQEVSDSQKRRDEINAGILKRQKEEADAQAKREAEAQETAQFTPEEKAELGITEVEQTQEQKDLEASIGELGKQATETADALDIASANMTDSQRALINSIKGKFDVRRRQQEEINKRTLALQRTAGIRRGTAQFAPEIQTSILSSEERAGVQKLGELDALEAEIVADAELALSTENFKQLSEKLSRIDDIKKEKQEALNKLNEVQTEEQEKINERFEQSTRDSSIADLVNQGITDPFQILNFMNFDEEGNRIGDITFDEVLNVTDAIKERAGEDFQGIVGEWKDAIRAGAIDETMSLFDYINQKDPEKALRIKKLGLDIEKKEEELRGSPGDELIGTGVDRAISDAMRVLKFTSVADRKDANAFVRDLVAEGRIEDAKEALMSFVLNSVSATQQDVIRGKDESVRALESIQNKLQEFEDAGGDTNIFTGLSEKVLQKGGLTKDPALAEITNDIAIAIIDYRRAVSGAAFTESEGKAYEDVWPSIGRTKELNEAKIRSLINKMNDDKDGFVKLKIGDRKFNQIFGEDQTITPEDDSKLNDDEAFEVYQQSLKEE